MSKTDDYARALRRLVDWDEYLRTNSGLPGPRGNLELAQAAARESSWARIAAWLSLPDEQAKENTPDVFLVFCGVLSLGRLIAAGEHAHVRQLREYASDSRWRIREAVAMALQTVGDKDMPFLLNQIESWAAGNWYEQRAVAAGLCEPRLLQDTRTAKLVILVLDTITSNLSRSKARKEDGFRVLRQPMAYCWSVAVVAAPATGKPAFEKWLPRTDTDVRWVLRQNLKKSRMTRMDPDWVKSCLRHLA